MMLNFFVLFLSFFKSGGESLEFSPGVGYLHEVERPIMFATKSDRLVFSYKCNVDGEHTLTAHIISEENTVLSESLWFNEISCLDIENGADINKRLRELISFSVLTIDAARADLREAEISGPERFSIRQSGIRCYESNSSGKIKDVFAYPAGRERIRYLAFDSHKKMVVTLFDISW